MMPKVLSLTSSVPWNIKNLWYVIWTQGNESASFSTSFLFLFITLFLSHVFLSWILAPHPKENGNWFLPFLHPWHFTWHQLLSILPFPVLLMSTPSRPSPWPASFLIPLFSLVTFQPFVLTLPESSFWNSGQAMSLHFISSILMYSNPQKVKKPHFIFCFLLIFAQIYLTITYQRLFPKGRYFSSPLSARENWASLKLTTCLYPWSW